VNVTDWLGVEIEWRHALVDPALARCAEGETTPAAEWAAYRAAVAWGRSHLFGVALGDWDGVLALPLARAAARRLTEYLRRLRQRADNLPGFWEKADDDIEGREECLALLEGRMEAWATFVALDEVQLDTLVNSLPGRSELAAECRQALGELIPADEALLRHKDFLSVAAGTELLANWRRLLVEPYRLSLPWWLDGSLEQVAGRLWNGLLAPRSGESQRAPDTARLANPLPPSCSGPHTLKGRSMTLQVFPIPNFTHTSLDLLLCDPTDTKPGSPGIVHYAYTVGADKDAVTRRSMPWMQTQDFTSEYRLKHPEVIERLKSRRGYRPGESVLDRPQGPTAETEHDAIIRLGALELLGNISSGRLAPTDKDPFPHQLALQQHVRELTARKGTRRILIADEVGLGKTIEVALILRDMLLARGRVDDFRCLYLTSGGLVDDAVAKLKDVLSGSIDDRKIVATVSSFRDYGKEDTTGVHVASMHAARRYVGEKQKKNLQPGNRPQVVIIDECHHAASEGELAGMVLRRSDATQTYMAVKQLLSGEFWPDSEPPELAILMSATPFRSRSQFVNLLRLLTDGVPRPDGSRFKAFDAGVNAEQLRSVLQDEKAAATVAWRRQSDEGVRSWTGKRIFPNLTIVRPHLATEGDPTTPQLPAPSSQFLALLTQVKSTVARIAKNHGQSFGGFAIAQLEKKLTSSSIAGACTLFTWAVRRCEWATQDEYKKDKRTGTEGLRRLLRLISQRIAQGNPQARGKHATVSFPSHNFKFEADAVAPVGYLDGIREYSKKLRDDDSETGQWVADDSEICELVSLSERLLGVAPEGETVEGAQDTKLRWLNDMLGRYPDSRFILFTESLQTCDTLKNALVSRCAVLDGSMSKPQRLDAVEALRDPEGTVRVLVATSAADEGIDLQVASKVIHWDLSSSPATLMQRNGRAARLGQVQDVVAYYLILRGTHEHKRDSSLREKFAELGIDDEAMKSRILGSLSEEEEQQLDEAIEENDDRVAGDILKKAAKDNEEMDHELAAIRANLEPAQVLSREDLAKRLANWSKIGLPGSATDIKFEFDEVQWNRPVFDTVSRLEPATAKTAFVESERIRQLLVFDPEFLLFGPKLSGARPRLAGLPPWINKPNHHGKYGIVPSGTSDLLGKLFQGMARLKSADFLALPAAAIRDLLPGSEARWLLFCTHPLREAENVLAAKVRPYLTYYAFGELTDGAAVVPMNPEGADADEVHKFLERAETHALADKCVDFQDALLPQAAKQAGLILQEWVRSATQFGAASFLEEPKYFVPIPVCLVSVVS
jgi:superfamily II DNA or RNA helicase